MTRIPVLLLAAMLLAPMALANDPADEGDIQQAKLADDNATEPAIDLDAILDQANTITAAVGGAVEGAASGIGSAASTMFGFLGDAAQAMGKVVAAAVNVFADVSGIIAAGLATAAIGLIKGLGAAAEASGRMFALAMGGLGQLVGMVASAYGDLVASLRPAQMSTVAFGAVTATGATVSTGATGWAGWQALRKWGVIGSGFAPIAGFSRIADADLLDHPVRSQIFTAIQHHPGIHASALAREVDIGWGTVSHHLDKLQKASLVTTRKVNNQKCYFEQGGQISRQDMEAASAVKGDTAGAIAGFVHDHPMTTQKDMAESLGISAALASFHVKKLVNLGVLEKLRHGKETHLTTSSAMRRLLEADADLLVAMQQKSDEALQYGA